MKQLQYVILMLAMVGFACTKDDSQNPPTPTPDVQELIDACNYIQGGGASTTGGSMGTIYAVTTLTDSLDKQTGKPVRGSLRYAVNQSGARIIIFKVAGTIHLTQPLTIAKPDITILGQSAPGDGICLADYPLVINASNTIVRFLRVRLGDVSNTEYDAVSVNNATGVVLDHLSCSWSVDECVSCYGNTDFTMQYCIVSESLRNSVHGKGKHGYGGIWGGTNASFHHNLLAHHDSRNPRFDHDYVDATHIGPIDFVNNVVYNWKGNSAYGGEGSNHGGGGRHINFVNNYYKPGPATPAATTKLTDIGTRLVDPWTSCSNCTDKCGGSVVAPKIYLVGNTMTTSSAVTADNWKGATKAKSVAGVNTRWTDGLTPLVNEQTAEQAYETVLVKAGCSLHPDAVDTRIIEEVRSGTYTYEGKKGSTGGLIDTQADVGGWPELKSEEGPQDSDGDGIPDAWETKYGLDSNNPLDARKTTLVPNHINLEVYLNALVAHLY